MAESIVQDWLAEYESLEDPSELHTFASMHEHNHEISESLYTIFNERLKYPELIHAICNQFLSFYRSKEEQLKRFTLQFLPVLIHIYLNSVVIGDKKNCRSVETLLISIYNVEVSTEDGLQKTVSFRMPVLAQASIYHEEKSLHATDLRRWEDHSNRDVKWGPFTQIESINAQNRMKVMAALLFAYNQQLSLMQKSALFHLCRIASQIVNQGFSKIGHAHRSSYGNDPNSAIVPKPLPRIPLSSQFLVELVHAIYFAMFNDFGTVAIQTLEDIHHRATYEMFTDLILVTNAVRNSLHANPSGQPSDGPMGLSVALTPATNTVVVSKSMITNASFRTKKLPDDLDMEFLANLPHQLLPTTIERNENTEFITEEQHQQSVSGTGTGSSGTGKDYKTKLDAMMKNSRRWKTWGWKYSPGSKTSSIEEEPDSPKKSLSSSKNSSPNASPKIKVKQTLSQQITPTNSLNQQDSPTVSTSALALLPAALRRKKLPSPARKSSEIRSSAGARLYNEYEDSQDDSAEEHDSLLDNGRPASIHVLQTVDDIPIQDEHSAGALMSITEETEKEQQQIGSRNTGIRSSKEGGGVGGIKAQAHKALIAGFKKSKDLKAAAVTMGSSSSNKNSNADAVKEILGPPKPPVRKDKHLIINRNAIVITIPSNIDNTDYCIQPKSIQTIDNTTNNASSDLVQLQNLSNGSFMDTTTKLEKSLDNLDKSYCDVNNSIVNNQTNTDINAGNLLNSTNDSNQMHGGSTLV